MQLSIVIVSYNVRAFLEKCLLSVLQAAEGLETEIFVVDNNSVDDSVGLVRSKFPSVNLIANDRNLGFARANNQALRRATGRYVLLLNPDTVISEDTLRRCISFMDAHPAAGAVGVRMLDGTGRMLPESKRGLPSPLSAFFKVTGINALLPRSNFFNRYYLGGMDPEAINKVEVLTGAFMCLRKEVLDSVGLLDEDYFMYGEDIDLCYRILQAGKEIYYLPDTTIIHYKGESTRHSSMEYVRTFYRAMLIFVDKHYSGPKGFFLSNFLRAGVWLRAILSGLKRVALRLATPLADLVLLVATITGVTWVWQRVYFHDPQHFQSAFFKVNLPLYAGIWFVALVLFGAYDPGRNIRRVAGGMLFGTVIILIIYALLGTQYRSSRAVILLSALVACVVLALWTSFRNFALSGERKRRIAVVGSYGESARIMELLNRVAASIEIAGWVSPVDGVPMQDQIGHIDSLAEIVAAYKVNEIIFASGDLTFGEISRWMTQLGPDVRFKIASRESTSLIGSDSRKVAGELYASDIGFAIVHPLQKRNKRMFDIGMSVLVILGMPFSMLSKMLRRYIAHARKVLRGDLSWVGYDERDPMRGVLPLIRPGVFSPGRAHEKASMSGKELHMINYLYAREYRVWRDIEIFLRSRLRDL